MTAFSDRSRSPGAAVALAALLLATATASLANDSVLYSLRAATLQAFDRYVAATEASQSATLQASHFLWIEALPNRECTTAYAKLKSGEVEMQRVRPGDSSRGGAVPSGMIHHWKGLVFVPGASLDDVLRVLQDYDHHSTIYAPDVERSRIESRDGDHFRVFLRFRRRRVVTVVLDTEHDVHYYRDSPTRAHSRSSATRIAEVDHPGTPDEKEKNPGEDSGFLWRMETWWRMEQNDGGVYIQSEVVSLTRDIPAGLGWLIEPFVTSIPKESLQFTLNATRKAVVVKLKK